MHLKQLLLRLGVASLVFLVPLVLLPVGGSARQDTWQPVGLRGETVLAIALAKGDAERILYAETYTGLWRYTPAAGWQRIDASLPRSPLGGPALAAWRTVPGRAQQLYAVTGSGTARQLYRSDDGGSSWRMVGPAPGQMLRPPMIVTAGLNGVPDTVMLATDSRIQRSADGGASWTPGGPWPGVQAPNDRPGDRSGRAGVKLLLGDSSVPDRLYALVENGEAWASETGGLAWRVILPLAGEALARAEGSPSLAQEPSPAQLALNPSQSGINGRAQWGHVTSLALVPYSDGRIWAAMDGVLVAGTDGGASWSAVDSPAETSRPGNSRSGAPVVALLNDPRVQASLYAALADGHSYRSDDDGATWIALGAPGAARVNMLALDPETRGLLYAATEDGIWVRNVTPLQPTAVAPPAETTTPWPSLTPIPTATYTAVPTATPTPTHTATPLPTNTASPTPTSTATDTSTPLPSPTWTSPPATATAVVPTAAPTSADRERSGQGGEPSQPPPDPWKPR